MVYKISWESLSEGKKLDTDYALEKFITGAI